MDRLTTEAMALVMTLVCCTLMAAVDPIAAAESDPPRTASTDFSLLASPKAARPCRGPGPLRVA
jgi:hypothetical protein